MVASNYDDSLKRVLVHEGGYTNHPADPGGPTNFGITIHDYRMHKNPHATADDVKHMPLQDAKDIYRSKYWGAMHCDELPAGLDYAVFDYGVNSGIGRPPKVLSRIMKLPERTAFDAGLLSMIAKDKPELLIAELCDERLHFLQGLHTWSTFGKGWQSRVSDVRAVSLLMAKLPQPSAPLWKEPPKEPEKPAGALGSAYNAIAGLYRKIAS